EFLFAEQVAGLGKGRHPTAVHQAGVPADVIKMQVCAQYGVDAVWRETGRREVFQEGGLDVAEHVVFPLSVRSDARVYHDVPPARAQHEGLEGDLHEPCGRGEVRPEPGELPHEFGRFVLEQHGDVVLEGVHFDDAGDLDVADLPMSDVLPHLTVS